MFERDLMVKQEQFKDLLRQRELERLLPREEKQASRPHSLPGETRRLLLFPVRLLVTLLRPVRLGTEASQQDIS